MIGDLFEILKNYGLGGVGTFLGGLNMIINTHKLPKKLFYEYKEETEEKLNKGNIRFTEIETNIKCLPDMQKDITAILQSVAKIQGAMGIKD